VINGLKFTDKDLQDRTLSVTSQKPGFEHITRTQKSPCCRTSQVSDRGRGKSVQPRLVTQSRDSALAAIQIYNNPSVQFKSESFIVLMLISWTYLLHAHYRKTGIEYRYFKTVAGRRRFERTGDGGFKYWELNQCLKEFTCPLDDATKSNLQFLIGLRNEITHHMSPELDDYISSRCQACCVNFNDFLKRLHGTKYGLDSVMSYSIQLQRLSREQVNIGETSVIPERIRTYITNFDQGLPDGIMNDERYAYRMLFVPRVVGKPGQADHVIEFVKADSELAKTINSNYELIKETERPKFLPSAVVRQMQEMGYPNFSITSHTRLWQGNDAKNPAKGYGVEVEGTWYWYKLWIDFVRRHCSDNASLYR